MQGEIQELFQNGMIDTDDFRQATLILRSEINKQDKLN